MRTGGVFQKPCSGESITTCAVSSASRYPAPWMFNFWHEYHQPEEPEEVSTFASVKAEEVVDIGLEFLKDSQEDFFLYLQFWDPHVPMQRPEEEVKDFTDMDMPEHPTEEQIKSHQKWSTKNSASEKEIKNREDLRKLYAEYRAEVNHVDSELGRLIEHLKDQGIYQESLIILTADHGEEFGEHGVYQEHWSTNENIQRVPLMIKPPKEPEKQEIEEITGNVDIPATILDYMGLEKPEKWQGRSLKPLIQDESFDWRDFMVMDHGLHTAQRCIREDEWKMIQTFHPGDWGRKIQEMQLFNVEEDPFEQENLALEKPKLVEELKQKMDLWVERRKHGQDPLGKIGKQGPAGFRYLENSFED